MSMESRSTKSRRRKPPDVFPHLLTRALGEEAIIEQKYFWVFFDHSLVILLVTKQSRVCSKNSVRIPGSST